MAKRESALELHWDMYAVVDDQNKIITETAILSEAMLDMTEGRRIEILSYSEEKNTGCVRLEGRRPLQSI